MRKWKIKPGFPLLARELYEQAHRPWLYVVRVLFSILILVLGLWSMRGVYAAYGPTPRLLGAGNELLQTLVLIELLAVALFVPALVAPCIAGETEKKTLPLLLITDMRPWEILSQKLFSRMVPILTFFLLAMPTVAVAYLFGGIDKWVIAYNLYLLVTVMSLVGTICLWLSARCKTGAGAIVACYLAGPLAFYAAMVIGTNIGAAIAGVLQVTNGWWSGTRIIVVRDALGFPTVRGTGVGSQMIWVIATLPLWLFCLYFFWRARSVMVSKLTSPPPKWSELTARAMPALVRPRPLPGDEPIAWRQRYTKAGKTGRLGFTAIAIVSVTITLGLMASHDKVLLLGATIGRIGIGVWAFGALMLVLQAASAFSAERSQDTLTILMTTPMTGCELMRQKMVLMRRWTKVFAGALTVFAILQGWAYVRTAGDPWFAVAPALTLFLSGVIYLPLLTWAGMMIGLCITSHERAASTAITMIAAWLLGGVAGPMFLLELLHVPQGSPGWYMTLLSPATILVEAQFNTLDEHLWGWPLAVVLGNFILYGGAMWALRRHVLKHADEYLGRAARRTTKSTKDTVNTKEKQRVVEA